jgi:twinkle protein
LSNDAFQNRSILLCEGQIDAMTWTQWGIPALSIPNGSGQTWIDYEWENLAVFDKIYMSFDMDDAGRANLDKVISRLGRHRCLLVTLPRKDANDCLLAGYTSDEAQSWIADAKAPGVKGLVSAMELKANYSGVSLVKTPVYTLPFLRGMIMKVVWILS